MFRSKKVYVMMSGGVDSSVAAACLVEQGYDVKGVFMKCWSLDALEKLGVSKDLYGCFWEDDAQDAQLVAKKLGIPFEIWDFQGEYRQKVVDYMIREYRSGRTPNPDVMCNSTIKFGIFYKKAIELGADFVATGHYARMVKIENLKLKNESEFFVVSSSLISDATRQVRESLYSNTKLIARGLDSNKDQSYFIWGIKKEQLDHILFPVGEFESKSKVREKAEQLDLITAKKPDSQGLCFIGQTPLRELLLQTLGEKDGDIVDGSGRVLGRHRGSYLYTVGQREKLGLSGGPWFVTNIDIDKNEVVVSHQDELKPLFSSQLVARDLNWFVDYTKTVIQANLDEPIPSLILHCQAQIRYRQIPEKCIVEIFSDHAKVKFKSPVRAVAKGQSIVFYDGDIILGGGVIC